MSEQMNPKVKYLVDDKRIKEIVSALRTIEDLKGLTEEEFTWLAIHGTERFGDDGDLIFSQGTPPRHLMFILSGDVLVHRHSSSPVSALIGQTGRITGKTLSTGLQGKTILVEITDTGQGIPAECTNRVFEPFFTTKPFGTGLGLGLDTAQLAIQKHFGAVAFDSQPNKTIFHVRLPLDRTEVY